MKSIAAYLNESILSSSGAGKQYIEDDFKKYGLNPAKVTYNADGTIDYDGDVDLSRNGLDKLPVRFTEVKGSFLCDNNQLTTLEGCPKIVGDSFTCSNNQLTCLEGGPESVYGEHGYECKNNRLRSLKGAPKNCHAFDCSENKSLDTLKGAPQKLKKFKCNVCSITSLEGGPKIVSVGFECNNNQLKSLKGAPQTDMVLFDCSYNEITSLEGGPAGTVNDYFCSYNKLVTLKGAPKATINFICNDNSLTSLDYLPTVMKWLQISNCGATIYHSDLQEIKAKTNYKYITYK